MRTGQFSRMMLTTLQLAHLRMQHQTGMSSKLLDHGWVVWKNGDLLADILPGY